jgi:uncharacterized protein YdeI (YjbR/CyaY-like superfamily)
MPAEPIHFRNAAALRQWFARHAATSSELVVGFTKKAAGARPGLTWPEAVDEALCVGWIDGVRHRVDDFGYTIRFAPRKPGSNWSAVNIERARELQKLGRMKPAGSAAFAQRTERKSRTASYEQQQQIAFSAAETRKFKAHAAAWTYFGKLPPSYRKKATWWIISAKQAGTRDRRLSSLIQACSDGRRL